MALIRIGDQASHLFLGNRHEQLWGRPTCWKAILGILIVFCVGSVVNSKVGSQHKAMKAIRPPPRSGRSPSGASLVPSPIVGHLTTSSMPLRPRVLHTFRSRCEAAAMIGPVVRCAMGSCLTLAVCGM